MLQLHSIVTNGSGVCICAGSDDGRVFIYDARGGAPIIALEADEDVANCVAPHPSLPVLATSGIESAVRLWSPKGPAATPDLAQEIAANQVSRQPKFPMASGTF